MLVMETQNLVGDELDTSIQEVEFVAVKVVID